MAWKMTDFDRHVLCQYYGRHLRRHGLPAVVRLARRLQKWIPDERSRINLVHRRWQTMIECESCEATL